MKTIPLIITSLILLGLAWRFSAFFLVISIAFAGFSFYRFLYIRATTYLIAPGYLKITRGIFFKRTDHIELFRIKDYIITRPFVFQLFRLMDLTLKGTDPENPVVWLRGIPESDIVDTIRERILEGRQQNSVYEIN